MGDHSPHVSFNDIKTGQGFGGVYFSEQKKQTSKINGDLKKAETYLSRQIQRSEIDYLIEQLKAINIDLANPKTFTPPLNKEEINSLRSLLDILSKKRKAID